MQSASTLPDDPLAHLLLARQLARQAGDLIYSARHPPPMSPSSTTATPSLSISAKSGSSDLVTSADHASQGLIFSALRAAYPTHRLIGEEDADADAYAALDHRPTWIVDAIDGTTNYVHALADYAVSIAFVRHKSVQVGVVYAPERGGEMFSAVRGRGAFVNDRPVQVSGAGALKEALVVSEWGYEREVQGVQRMLAVNQRLLVGGVRGVRQLGSGALDMCYVAAGRVEAVYCGVAGEAWKIWDYAAASLIVEEAGGMLRELEGGEFQIWGGSMVCAAPGVVEELLEVIKG